MMLWKEPNQNPNPKTRLTKNPNQKSLGPARCFGESDKNPIFWEKKSESEQKNHFFSDSEPHKSDFADHLKSATKKNPLELSFLRSILKKIWLWSDFLQPLLDLFDQF